MAPLGGKESTQRCHWGETQTSPGAYQALPRGPEPDNTAIFRCGPGRWHQLAGSGGEPVYRGLPLSPSHGSSPQRSFKWAPVKAADRRYVLIHFREKYHVAHKRVPVLILRPGAPYPAGPPSVIVCGPSPGAGRGGPAGGASLAGRGQDLRAIRGSRAGKRMRPAPVYETAGRAGQASGMADGERGVPESDLDKSDIARGMTLFVCRHSDSGIDRSIITTAPQGSELVLP